MNYLTHAIRFLDRPVFMAGTAIPDWSVVDRKVRFRPQHLEPYLHSGPNSARNRGGDRTTSAL